MYISDSIKTEVVTVTPERAQQLLEQNKNNRRVSAKNLEKVEAIMSRGEWRLNGEAIKISTNGRILDGQHRLMASVNTGTTFQTLIVYGLTDETQETMDSGKSRTLADILSLRGYKSTHSLAAIVTAIIRSEIYGIKAAVSSGTAARPVTNQQAIRRIETEPTVVDLFNHVNGVTKAGLPGKIAGMLYYKFSEIDSDDTQFFFERLASGAGLERNHPILVLRALLLRLKSEPGAANSTYVTAVTIKAWNKFRAGEDCSQLKFRVGGASPETFPEPK